MRWYGKSRDISHVNAFNTQWSGAGRVFQGTREERVSMLWLMPRVRRNMRQHLMVMTAFHQFVRVRIPLGPPCLVAVVPVCGTIWFEKYDKVCSK